jgi:hypothetical protein
MTTGDWAFILIIVILVIAAIVCAIAWKVAFEDGHEAGSLHERNMRNENRIRNRTDRATGELWGLQRDDDKFDDWLRGLTDAYDERLASTGELRMISEDPGQPRTDNRTTRAGTHTGSFRTLLAAQTDAFIAQMQLEEGAYREDLTA